VETRVREGRVTELNTTVPREEKAYRTAVSVVAVVNLLAGGRVSGVDAILIGCTVGQLLLVRTQYIS